MLAGRKSSDAKRLTSNAQRRTVLQHRKALGVGRFAFGVAYIAVAGNGIAALITRLSTPPPRCAERVGEHSSAPTTCSLERLRLRGGPRRQSRFYARSSPLDPSTPPAGGDGSRRSPPSAFSPLRVFCVAPIELPEIPTSRSVPMPRVFPILVDGLGVF
jgi:hypothetical protein